MLVREHRALQEEQGEDDTLARAAADCEQVLARASRWPVQDRGWDSLEAGMGKVVRDGRHRMTKACVKARAEDFQSGASR